MLICRVDVYTQTMESPSGSKLLLEEKHYPFKFCTVNQPMVRYMITIQDWQVSLRADWATKNGWCAVGFNFVKVLLFACAHAGAGLIAVGSEDCTICLLAIQPSCILHFLEQYLVQYSLCHTNLIPRHSKIFATSNWKGLVQLASFPGSPRAWMVHMWTSSISHSRVELAWEWG